MENMEPERSQLLEWDFWIKSFSDTEGFSYRGKGFCLAHAWPILSATEYVSDYRLTGGCNPQERA
jgi:hypothetical protein